MVRSAPFFRWSVIFVAGTLTWAPAAPAAPPDGSAPADQAIEVSRVKEIRDKLAKPLTLEKGFEANTTLRETLEFVGGQYHLTIVVNTQGFKTEGQDAVEDQPVKLPKVTDMKLGTVLRLLLAQVQGTYLIHPDYVEVVPLEHVRTELWKGNRNVVPTVSVEFAERPLDEALQELSDVSGINVVLDGRAANAKVKVTARLNNVPIDTAVLILADMAELRPVMLDNVLYVTAKESAEELKAWNHEQHQKAARPERHPSPSGAEPDTGGK